MREDALGPDVIFADFFFAPAGRSQMCSVLCLCPFALFVVSRALARADGAAQNILIWYLITRLFLTRPANTLFPSA